MQSNRNFYFLLVELQNGTATLEDSLVASYKVKNSLIIWFSIIVLDIYQTDLKTCVRMKICTYMLIAALFIIPLKGKQPRCSSIAEWIDKLWYFHTMECHSVIKKKLL